MKMRRWIVIWGILSAAMLFLTGGAVYVVDPFFHYHVPDTEHYFYALEADEERYLNDGICRNFSYDALITGTSMAEQFRASEMDEIFDCHAIKVCYAGGSYKEIDDNLMRALSANPDVRIVVRGLDSSLFLKSADYIADYYDHPDYLYDKDPLNDVQYVLNRDVLYGKVLPMLEDALRSRKAGITSFDEYAVWEHQHSFGIGSVLEVLPEAADDPVNVSQPALTDEMKDMIRQNIRQNVTDTADAWPEVEFYYYFNPVSVYWYRLQAQNGLSIQMEEARKYITELILEHPNIHLFSFGDRYDISCDLNNYRDAWHYGSWVNSLMLRWMHEGTGLLTWENYEERLQAEADFYRSFDYESLKGQPDYPDDYYAGALLCEELTGRSPVNVVADGEISFELRGARIMADAYVGAPLERRGAESVTDAEGEMSVFCTGALQRAPESEESLADYLRDTEYVGLRFRIDPEWGYDYLSFQGTKTADHGQPTVYLYDESGSVLRSVELTYKEIGLEKHRWTLDLRDYAGQVTVVMNGGYVDNTGSPESGYLFSDILLY